MSDTQTFLTPRELAAKTGLPSNYLRREAIAGRLPYIRTRTQLLFPADAAIRALEKRAIGMMSAAAAGGATMSDERPDVTAIGLRPAAACRALGVSRRTLCTWTADRTLGMPYCKIGKVIVYPERELRDWLTSRIERPH